MIKNLHKLSDLTCTQFKSTILLSSTLLLLGGYAAAQNKVDPRFEQLIKQKKSNQLSKINSEAFNTENQLSTSTIVLPNGQSEELYHAIIYTNSVETLKAKGILVQAVSKDFVTALVSIDQLNDFHFDNNIISVESPKVDLLHNQIARNESGAELLHNGALNNINYTGKDVLVGIFDTGIDFSHPDFRDAQDQTKSRILRIWDQTLTAGAGENAPQGFSYGVEYTQNQINDELDGTPANFVRQKDLNTHGTHVAGTAAGNGMGMSSRLYKGMAPEANIVVVKGSDTSFTQSNQINALEYFKVLSNTLGKPIVVNMSIGGQYSTHDGTSANEVKINEFTSSGPGKVVVISAGNDGSGNIHQRIDLEPNEKKTIIVSVSEAVATSTAKNLFSFVTYNKGLQNNAQITARLKGPDGVVYTQVPGSDGVYTIPNADNTGSISMTLYNYWATSNQKRYLDLSVNRSGSNVKTAGNYELEIENNATTKQTIDAWFYSKDIPSTFVNGDNYYTVSTPGAADNAITVGNYTGRSIVPNRTSGYSYYYSLPTGQLNPSSSKGPRADEVQKPDIATDGTNVISARPSYSTVASTVDKNQYYSLKTGTSMSSPGVAGAVALLLQANKNLNFQDIKTLLTKNANKDEYTTNSVTREYGHGKLNIYNAVQEAVNNLNGNTSCPISNFKMLGYDNTTEVYSPTDLPSAGYYNIGSTTPQSFGRLAVKYTPDISGKLQSIYIFTGSSTVDANKKVPFTIELRKPNEDGSVGDLIATKTIEDIQTLGHFEWTNFDVADLNYKTTSGKDFYVVVYSDQFAYRLFFDKTNIDKRTYFSSDDGKTFKLTTALDAKIRAIVYENEPGVKQLAKTSKTATQGVNLGYNYFVNGCELITRVEASGAAPITGSTTAKAWVDANVKDFVQRRIEVNAAGNNSTSTGKVTLFYSQADFDAFNKTATVKLPTSPTDVDNKKNVVVHFYAGTSSDNTGTPSSYTSKVVNTLVPAENVIWNDTYNYWEVTVDAIGFGGYLMSTNSTLAIKDNSLNELSIYPNPVVNELTINLPSNIKNADVRIVDVTGRTISNNNVTINNNKLDVSHLAQGVYIVEIKTEKGTTSKKLIKK